jgi:hypothetical protein
VPDDGIAADARDDQRLADDAPNEQQYIRKRLPSEDQWRRKCQLNLKIVAMDAEFLKRLWD